MQFPGTTIPAELLNALPYMTDLQRLSLRSQQREMIVLSAQPLWIGSIEPILRCMRLRFLDMSYTDMNITLVSSPCKAPGKLTHVQPLLQAELARFLNREIDQRKKQT